MKHLTQEQRYEIYLMRQSGKTQTEIAAVVGCSQAAISKELKKERQKKAITVQNLHRK